MGNEFNKLYEFAGFRFDVKRNRLWRNGDAVSLSPKASDVLALLLERNGEFVSKEEIFECVWKDTFVEEGVLTQNVYVLRKALGKNPDGNHLIENRNRFGYRVTVPVRLIDAPNGADIPISGSTDSGSVQGNEALKARPVPRRRRVAIGAVAVLLVALPVIFAGWYFFRPVVASWLRKPIESVKFTRLTNSGDLTTSVISPDGNLIAFIREDSVYLKDINTEKELKLEVPNVRSFSALNFSPDGEHLYFRNNRVLSTQASIMRVSRFGGEAEQVVERSWGSFSVSPDGEKIAYVINVPPVAKFNLKVRELGTGDEKEFFITEQPQSPCLVCSPAWSPDSRKIVFSTNIPNSTGQLWVFDMASGEKSEIKPDKLRRFEQAAWLPDGGSFIVSASDGSRFFHLWKVFVPDGQVLPITNGLSSYTKVSVSSDGRRVLALRSDETANIFVADSAKLSEPKQVTTGNQNSFGQNGLHWIDDGRIIFSTQTEQNLTDNLAIVNLADNSRTAVTSDRQNSYRVPVSNGRSIWYTMNKDGSAQIFQMDLDGKNQRQLTSGTDGQRQSPRVTNDSRYLYYVRRGRDGASILRYDLQLEKEEVFFSHPEFQPGPFLELSPDNKYLTFFRMQNRPAGADDESNAVMTVLSIEKPTDIKFFPVSAVPPIRRFSPDSKAIDYIYAPTDATQIVRQTFDGGEVMPIFTTSEGKVFNFAWSKDGKRLAISIGHQLRDAVLLTDLN